MKNISKAKLAGMLEDALAAFGPQGHPAYRLLAIINDPSTPKSLVVEACAKLMPFVAARMAKIEIGDPQGNAIGNTYIDQVQIVASLYAAKTDPAKRAQLFEALNAAPAPEVPEDESGPE